jgi:hypothetical protein
MRFKENLLIVSTNGSHFGYTHVTDMSDKLGDFVAMIYEVARLSKLKKSIEEVNQEYIDSIHVGSEGTRHFSTGYGRSSWVGFVVVERNKSGKTIVIKLDESDEDGENLTLTFRTLKNRRGHFAKKGDKDRCYSYVFGERKTGCEKGIF